MAAPFQFLVQFVEHQIAQQRGERAALRRTLLGRTDQPVFQHPGAKKRPDEGEHALVGHPLGHAGHQAVLVDSVEEFLEVDVNHHVVAVGDVRLCLGYGLMCRTSRTESIAVLGERRVPLNLEHLQQRLLYQAVDDTWYAEPSDAAGRFRDVDPFDRLRCVGPREQLFPDGWPVLPQVGRGVVRWSVRRRRDYPCFHGRVSTLFQGCFGRTHSSMSWSSAAGRSVVRFAVSGSVPWRSAAEGSPRRFGAKAKRNCVCWVFWPRSTHESRVLLATPNRSGLRQVTTAVRSLAVSALSGQCLDRAGRRVPSTAPSADFCAPVRSSRDSLSPTRDGTQISRGKSDRLHRSPAGSTAVALDGCGLRDKWPARPTTDASYPISVRQVAALLHASSRPRLAAAPLRFASHFASIRLCRGLAPPSCQTCPAHH